MKVVIVGAGEVGYHVIGALYRENVDIVAIDLNQAVLDQLKSEFNITTLLGNATDSDLLERAGAKEADMFLAVTNYDETNIISCLLAGQMGAAKKIARVKTIDIGYDTSFTEKHHLGIELIINPYQVAAEHLSNLIVHPQVTDFHQFLSDRVALLRIPIREQSPLAKSTVLSFGQNAGIQQCLIALIQRKGSYSIPTSDTVVHPGDDVYFFCAISQLDRLFGFLKLPNRPLRRVFINGGGHIGFALAKRLEKLSVYVRILEISEERCEWLSSHLDKALILNVDGSNAAQLRAEGIEHADYFISVTDADHVNVVACLLAKELGAARTISLVKQPELLPILHERGMIDVAFSPRLLTARKLLRFVRGEQLSSFLTFVNSDVELLELHIQRGVPCEQLQLSGLGLPAGVLVGAVKRGEEIFIPRGDDSLCEGDTILLLEQRRHRKITKSLFLEPGEFSSPPLDSDREKTASVSST